MAMKKLKRILAGVLAGALVGTCSIPGIVRAEGDDAGSSVSEEKATQAEECTVSEKQEAIEEQQSDGKAAESLLNYLYVESPYLETPAEESLVVSWGDGTETVEKMEVVYQYNGLENSFELENKGEGLYLYQKEFTEAESGVYELTNLRVKEAGQESTYNLDEVGIQAYFGVNEYYPGYEPEVTGGTAGSDVGVAVVTEEDIENSEAEEIVSDALASVGAEANGAAEISVLALNDNARLSSNGQIVVALDAGHCDLHAGASGNGVREEVATLKIAQYCKEELEKYSGVKVYMCRTTAACPYPEVNQEISTPSARPIEDIRRRVRASVQQGADIYVSIHLNSSTATTAYGAEVWYPDGSQTPNTVGAGKELAQKIQSELVSLGLYNRGAKETDDNFACMDEGGKYNLPAIIVEHAFLSNAGDANKYLKTEAGLKSLGIADATGIVKYFGLGVGFWEDVNGHPMWNDGSGNYARNTWIRYAESWYWVDKEGYRVTGLQEIAGVKYYFELDGRMITGWKKLDDGWHYFNSSGGMLTGWVNLGGHWYYLNINGVMQEGWLILGGEKYYFNQSGIMETGLKTIDGEKYYFNTSGQMQSNCWKTVSGKKYYFGGEGKALKNGWHTVGGKKYLFDENGVLAQSGWAKVDGKYYWIQSDGTYAVGWLKLAGYWYYFHKDGSMQEKGWLDLGYAKYYINQSGIMETGLKTIDGEKYYFNTGGAMETNCWQTVSGKTYYFGGEGQALKNGWHTVGGTWYYFDESGIWDSNPASYPPMSGKTAIIATTEVTIEQMAKYYKASGHQYPSYYAEHDKEAKTIEDFCRIYKEESTAQGICTEVAFCQSMKETGWLQFGGTITIEQFNFAGIGATDGGAKGASFASVRLGIRAQIQHLYAYATKEQENELKYPCVDPRYGLVMRGTAPYVEWLGIPDNPYGVGWASAQNYGSSIIKMMQALKQTN